jgi:hypothetical protein
VALCALPLMMQAQTTTTPTAPAAVMLPATFSVGGEFNQLATPKGSAFMDFLYTTSSQNSIGMANDTGVDLVVTKAKDAATGTSFYAINAEVNQCIDEKLIATGKFRMYLGVCGGPSFASTQTGGISISATGSFKAVMTYRLNPWMSLVVPVRMNYIGGEGWNPILAAGISFDLKKLPAAK